ncbi:hypothetical protein QJS10_CPA05g01829 [Acorus calamus]|uniref:Uncharacterized protein n=1 Tax=Acorus calamus TaxID=4465 RepID=A0AAV9EV78_ACOCL|nr:hypothetical protein QJS10_CPA05g01829 [Acorus calamus]
MEVTIASDSPTSKSPPSLRTPRSVNSPHQRHRHRHRLPHAMSALEILRETIRILRADPVRFLSFAAFLIGPVSAVYLTNFLLSRSLTRRLSFRLLVVSRSVGLLPSSPFLRRACHHLSGTVVSAAFCAPLFGSILLTAKAAVIYSIAHAYAGKDFETVKLFPLILDIRRRLLSTFLCVCVANVCCLALFIALLFISCNAFALMAFPPDVIAYVAFVVVFAFFMAFALTTIVCNLATVISVLESASGAKAFLRSLDLVRGQTQAGLLIFLGSTIGMNCVEGLFEHRVKTLSYGDGSSRIWEGPLLVGMYSFVVLIDSMMSAVFYFTCRSSSLGGASDGDDGGLSLLEAKAGSPLSVEGQ